MPVKSILIRKNAVEPSVNEDCVKEDDHQEVFSEMEDVEIIESDRSD